MSIPIVDERLLAELEETCNDMLDVIKKIKDGFRKNSLKILDGAYEKALIIHKAENKLLEALVLDANKPSTRARYIISIPAHLERIGDNMESIIRCLKIKASEMIMFSDKAVKEVTDLMDLTADIITCVRDMILTRNHILITAVEEKSTLLINMADNFATEHEERLISGICSPKASSIYLDLLDSMSELASHAKDIAHIIKAVP